MITLQQVFENVNGASFVGLDHETIVPLRGGKANPLQGRVTKRTEGSSVIVFQNKRTNGYQMMVMRRLLQEGKDPDSFVLSPRKWGHRINGTCFVEHEGEQYLEVIFLHAGRTIYLIDGQQYDDDIDGLPPTPVEADQGGLDNKVIIRTLKIRSVRAVRIDGQQIDFVRSH